MSEYAIKVENLGKKYRLIDAASKAEKLENIWDYIALPWRRFQEIRSLTSIKEDDEDKIFWALKDINFELKHGEVLGIIGRNGAGKSTLLKILSKITSPSVGRAEINGRVNSLLEVGTGFNSSLTGRENIYMNGTIHGMTKKEIDSKLDEIAEFAGLAEGFLDIPVKRYSSGMKVRLGFSVAAHLEPEILIVDEVLAVGDAQFKRKCMGKMGDVTQQGRTVILVSHAMENIEQLCDRCIWLHEGEIVEDGEAFTVVQNYLDSFREDVFQRKLIDRDDRKGTGDFKIADYRLLNDQNEKLQYVKTGQKLTIEVDVHKFSPKNYETADLGLMVFDVNGKNIFNMSGSLKRQFFKLDQDVTTIRYELPKLLLNPGNYLIRIWLAGILLGKNIPIDTISNAFELNVHYGSFYDEITDDIDASKYKGLISVDYTINHNHSAKMGVNV